MARDTNTQEGARADIRIKGYLGSFQNTYFDVQIINAQSQCYEKKHAQTSDEESRREKGTSIKRQDPKC